MSEQPLPSTLIVGGGMLGLALAHYLTDAGQKVTVLEASPALGGLAASWQVGEIQWDKFYHVTLLSDANLRGLLKDLDLEKDIVWKTTRTEFYQQGKRYPLNNALDFLRLPVLNLIDKLRLGLTIIYGSRRSHSDDLEALPVARWLTRWSGSKVYQRLWRPLLKAKLGSNAERVSAAFIWSVIQRFYAARKGGLKTEMFGYVPGGYSTVTQALSDSLQKRGVKILCGAPVKQVRRRNGQSEVCTDAHTFIADRVILTCDSHKVSTMLPDLSEPLQRRHQNLKYQGVVCVSVVTDKPLTGAYLTYITDAEIPFTTVIDMSELVGFKTPGRYLAYLPKYVDSEDPILQSSDEAITDTFVKAMLNMYPHLSGKNILATRVGRAQKVVSLPTLHYSKQVPPVETNIDGVFVFNSAQIHNAALSVESTVALARRGADLFQEPG